MLKVSLTDTKECWIATRRSLLCLRRSRIGRCLCQQLRRWIIPLPLIESSSTPATSEVTPNKKRAKTSQSSNDATLIVRTLTGKVLSFRMPLSTSIDEVKVKIQEVDGSPTCQQRLVFQGRQLEDGLTLSDYNVTSNDTIHMVLNLRGC